MEVLLWQIKKQKSRKVTKADFATEKVKSKKNFAAKPNKNSGKKAGKPNKKKK